MLILIVSEVFVHVWDSLTFKLIYISIQNLRRYNSTQNTKKGEFINGKGFKVYCCGYEAFVYDFLLWLT